MSEESTFLKIAGFPNFINENLDKEKIKSLRAEMESRYKAMGIIGVLEFDPDAAVVGKPENKEFMNMSPAERVPQSGRPHARYSIPGKKNPDNLIKIQVSVKTANEILKETGIDPDDYIKKSGQEREICDPSARRQISLL